MHALLHAAKADLHLLGRLVIAGVLGALLGLERERSGKAAGIRTFTTVSLASALFVSLAEVTSQGSARTSCDLGSEPAMRAVQAVATGIGFLGAGVIFVGDRDRDGDGDGDATQRVRGLTTAATIWAAGAVGLSAGMGRYVLASGATLLLWLTLRGLRRFEQF